MGVKVRTERKSTRIPQVSYHSEMAEEGKVKELDRELRASRRKPREGSIRDIWKKKFFKEEVTKCVKCHRRTEYMRLEN